MFFKKEEPGFFTINPLTLKFNNNEVVETKAQQILFEKKIALQLYVQDRLPKNQTPKGTLFFIHGNSTSSKVFDKQIEHYQKTFRVIWVDLLGHGKSSHISNFNNINEEEKSILSEFFYNPVCLSAQLTQLLLNILGKEKAHLLGWSLGGHLAYAIAAEQPELVSSIITFAAPPVRFSSSGFIKGFSNWFMKTIEEWIKNPQHYTPLQAGGMSQSMGFSLSDEAMIDDLVKTDPLMRKYLFTRLSSYDEPIFDGTGLDAENFVTTTKIPLYMAVGSEDVGVNPEAIRCVSPKLKVRNSLAHVIEGAKHNFFNNSEYDLTQAIDKFIVSISVEPSKKDLTHTTSNLN